MAIDEYMPAWDVRSSHQIAVDASPEDTYAALRTADLGRHPIVRALLGLRALPAALVSGRLGELRQRAAGRITLVDLEQQGFRVLAERPPFDLVLGLEGAFWRPTGGLKRVDPDTFTDPVPAGVARATWSFAVEPVTATASKLSTETRVRSGGQAARRFFRVYWVSIGWASGLIRYFVLRAIKAEAETRTRSRLRTGRDATP